MLDELFVANLGIIAEARLEPGPGLVAITGETGAGKTLLLGAIRLLRGEPARSDRVGPLAEEARVEGRFSIEGTETVLARRVGGRSRAYLDGSMVPARALAERVDALIEVVAQHEHVSIGRESSMRAMVDGLLDAEGRDALGGYQAAWQELSVLRDQQKALGSDPTALARDVDIARHQLAEIRGSGLQPAEDDELKRMLTRLRHGDDIARALGAAASLLEGDGGTNDTARSALSEVTAARHLDATLEPIAGLLASVVAELEEAGASIRSALEALEHDPAALAALEERAAVVAALKRKYGATADEVLEFADSLETRITHLDEVARRADSIAVDIAATETEVAAWGERLTEARRRAAKSLVETAASTLRRLGFADPLLEAAVTPGHPGPHGADKISLAFASDASLTPGPAAAVASGGELSRLVLALRLAAGVADAEILAFDEIDAGVGGATALELGGLLADLARRHQVLIVTHLPQIAAFADTHFVVERVETTAVVRRVDAQDRLAELARMLGGLEASERGRLHAEELLEVAAGRRSASTDSEAPGGPA